MPHDSIKLLLDSIEREYSKRPTHSELARALNVSEQVVTNWAKRGISVEGALAAQFAFHKDANFILGRVSHPMLVPRNQPPGKEPQINEPQAVYKITPANKDAELLAAFRALDDAGKVEVLNFVKGFAAGRTSQTYGQALQVAG
jgi:hypothetical protein